MRGTTGIMRASRMIASFSLQVSSSLSLSLSLSKCFFSLQAWTSLELLDLGLDLSLYLQISRSLFLGERKGSLYRSHPQKDKKNMVLPIPKEISYRFRQLQSCRFLQKLVVARLPIPSRIGSCMWLPIARGIGSCAVTWCSKGLLPFARAICYRLLEESVVIGGTQHLYVA